MRHLTPLLLLALLARPVLADDKEKEPALKNPQAQSALTQLQKDLDAAEDAKRKAVTKAIQTAIPKLDKALKETMAKGDLDGANAIKAKMDALKAEMDALKEEWAQPPVHALNPVGSWKLPEINRISDYLPDGTCRIVGMFANPKAAPDNGKWKFMPDGSVEARWDGGWVHRLRPVKGHPNQMEVEGINPNGENTGKKIMDFLGNSK